jgi:hypothetical protein
MAKPDVESDIKWFPELLYVKIDASDKSQPLFVAFEEMYGLAEQGETVRIATYQLVEVDEIDLVLSVKKAPTDERG